MNIVKGNLPQVTMIQVSDNNGEKKVDGAMRLLKVNICNKKEAGV